jgi:hypothetical protein
MKLVVLINILYFSSHTSLYEQDLLKAARAMEFDLEKAY